MLTRARFELAQISLLQCGSTVVLQVFQLECSALDRSAILPIYFCDYFGLENLYRAGSGEHSVDDTPEPGANER